jgi:hypothetical protein
MTPIYHGTNAKNLSSILAKGIQPRGKKKGNWESFPSRPDMVYLTTAYAPFFAIQSCKTGEKALVLEIDMDKLDSRNLFPDEDFIVQAIAIQTNQAIEDVHEDIKNNIEDYQHHFEDSIRGLGNVSHKGIVPAGAVSRYCLIDTKKRLDLTVTSLDPSISLMNYRFCGERYRSIISWLFGDRPDFEIGIGGNETYLELMEKSQPGSKERTMQLFSNREGIEIVDLRPRPLVA